MELGAKRNLAYSLKAVAFTSRRVESESWTQIRQLRQTSLLSKSSIIKSHVMIASTKTSAWKVFSAALICKYGRTKTCA